MAPISLVDLPVSRTGPDPSGSAGSSRLCRGCSHPPRQPADQAASSFTPPLRRQGHGVFHLHPKQQRLVAQHQRLHHRQPGHQHIDQREHLRGQGIPQLPQRHQFAVADPYRRLQPGELSTKPINHRPIGLYGHKSGSCTLAAPRSSNPDPSVSRVADPPQRPQPHPARPATLHLRPTREWTRRNR
jgi:hypothetical protein